MSVFCPCREPCELTPSSIPSLLGRNECYFSANQLLFCPQCRAVRCPFCTTKEPVTWYCAQCLAESTKSQARQASNRCSRNCVQCPQCHTGLAASSSADTWRVQCPQCNYAHTMPRDPSMTLAQHCRALRNARFDRIQRWAAAALNHAPDSPNDANPSADALIPEPFPLRAKFVKSCVQCRTVLIDPELTPSETRFTTKSLARPVLPHLQWHSGKLILRNFGCQEMVVKLAGLNERTSVNLSEIRIPPQKAVDNVASQGFPAPLFLVERETVASRQAFMAGQAGTVKGPGWALAELDFPAESKSVYLFGSITSGDDEPIGAWFKLPV